MCYQSSDLYSLRSRRSFERPSTLRANNLPLSWKVSFQVDAHNCYYVFFLEYTLYICRNLPNNIDIINIDYDSTMLHYLMLMLETVQYYKLLFNMIMNIINNH